MVGSSQTIVPVAISSSTMVRIDGRKSSDQERTSLVSFACRIVASASDDAPPRPVEMRSLARTYSSAELATSCIVPCGLAGDWAQLRQSQR